MKVFNRPVKLGGHDRTVNDVDMRVLEYNVDGDILRCTGTTVPTADSAGFAKGCLFIKTDAADGTKGVYENQGTKLLSDFNLMGDISSAEIAADAITGAKIADDAVSLEHLDSGITPSHIVVYAGEFTTAGGDADETISVSGVVATDLVHVTVHTAGATPRTVVDASAGTDQIDVDMSGDPSTDHVLTYSVLRAVA